MLHSTTPQKLRNDAVTSASFLVPDEDKLVPDGTLNKFIIPMGLDGQSGSRFRGAEISFTGPSGVATFDYVIYRAKQFGGGGEIFQKLCTGTFTMGTAVSTGDVPGFPTGTCFATDITATPTALYSKLRTAYGSPDIQVHSPGTGGIAVLFVPDVGSGDLFVDLKSNGSAAINGTFELVV